MAKIYKKFVVREADANLSNFRYLRQTIKEIDYNKGNDFPAIREIANKVAKYEEMGKGIGKLPTAQQNAVKALRNTLKQDIISSFNKELGLGNGKQSEMGRLIAPINYNKYSQSYTYRTSIKVRVPENMVSDGSDSVAEWLEKYNSNDVFRRLVINRLNDVNYFSDYVTIHSTKYKRLLLVIRDAAMLPDNVDPEYALDLLDMAGITPSRIGKR